MLLPESEMYSYKNRNKDHEAQVNVTHHLPAAGTLHNWKEKSADEHYDADPGDDEAIRG